MSKLTPEAKQYILDNYGKKPNKNIYAHLSGHLPEQIKSFAWRNGLKAYGRWTPEDLEYLQEKVGTISDERLCKRLHRSKNAIHLALVRILKTNHKSNIYTAREVAKITGLKCSKGVIYWVRRGWLKGVKSTVKCGKTRMWKFMYEDIEKFVRSKPWLFDSARMEQSYFRSIIKEEYDKDPWYCIAKTCAMLNVSYVSSAMAFYIKKKWLHPVKKPIEGGNHWTWLFFKSDIDSFLANDPRLQRPLQMIESRRRKRLENGRAVRMWSVWKIKCPKCNETVELKTGISHIESPEVKRIFLEKYTRTEKCSHGSSCEIERPLKPYKSRAKKIRKKEAFQNDLCGMAGIFQKTA